MIPIEVIDYISAIIILGLFTSMIASFLKLSKDVNEKTKEIKEKYIERRAEKIKELLEKSSQTKIPEPVINLIKDMGMVDLELADEILTRVYELEKGLKSLKESIFFAIALFSITIFLSFTVYSSYSLLTFLIGFMLLFYASYKLLQLVSILKS